MNTERNRRKYDTSLMTVKFSIGLRLILIITIIVLVSLGSITALVSWLFREDLRIAAEDNNFEVNRRSAMEAETTLQVMRSNSMILMQSISALGSGSAIAEQSVQLFFDQNPQAAFLIFAAGGKTENLILNNRFFILREIDAAIADTFPVFYREPLRRAALGETVLLNASPLFKEPLLAILFPWRGGALGLLFSPEKMNDTFGFGTNQSFLINDSGDILVHADIDMVKNAANVSEMSFTKLIWNSPQHNEQLLYSDDEGTKYFGAFTKLNIGGAVAITSIEYDKVFEGITATTRRNLYLTITVLSISIMLIWFFSKSISVPLKVLADAAHEIEAGQFDQKLRPKGRSEIGVLTNSFQHMSTALNIFGRFTNKDVAIKAMHGEIKPGGLMKHATILFADIRDFTEKSENFTDTFGEEGSNRIVLWLNDYYTHMIECVEKTEGVVDKFIGDALMAHWGTATTAGSPQLDAINCVKTALLMRKELYIMNKNRNPEDHGNPQIHIGCGINTGIVTAGQIGSELRMEYTVMGDPVNLAYRTESYNKPLATDILITEDTWNLVKEYYITEEMPSVKVKGRRKPVRMFAVVNFARVKKGPRTLDEVRRIFGITKQEYHRRSSDTNVPAPHPRKNLELEGTFIAPAKRVSRNRNGAYKA